MTVISRSGVMPVIVRKSSRPYRWVIGKANLEDIANHPALMQGMETWRVRDGDKVELTSKAGKPLTRYFPDLAETMRSLRNQGRDSDGTWLIVEPFAG